MVMRGEFFYASQRIAPIRDGLVTCIQRFNSTKNAVE